MRLTGRKQGVKKWVNLFMIGGILAGFLSGCAGGLKDSKMKCPKCGTFFTTREGVEEFEKNRPR